MGEFPWAVRVGERVEVDDFVRPPEMLSLEKSGGELNWSLGTYIEGAQIWKAFDLPGAPPPARGVYSNQPSPYGSSVRQIWGTFLTLMLVWAVLLAGFTFTASNKEVFRHSYRFSQSEPGERSFVTDVFELGGRKSNVEVEIRTDLDNNWAYFNLALLREDGALGFDFGREVSYYRGRDSDGAWTEGAARDSAVVPGVPAGRYYLRIEPEMDAQASALAAAGQKMNYEIVVRRDVPRSALFWLVLPLLLIPPLFKTFRSAAFETRRWQESDYAPSGGGDE